MRRLGPLICAFALAPFPGPALAERVACAFAVPCPAEICVARETTVQFEIDPNQFVDPVAKGEPPRNKVTRVSLGGRSFEAEPIRMADGTRGFWANVAGVEHMMTVRPDGLGTYASTGAVPLMSGRCEVHK